MGGRSRRAWGTGRCGAAPSAGAGGPEGRRVREVAVAGGEVAAVAVAAGRADRARAWARGEGEREERGETSGARGDHRGLCVGDGRRARRGANVARPAPSPQRPADDRAGRTLRDTSPGGASWGIGRAARKQGERMSDETKSEWHDLGATDDLAKAPLQELRVGRTRLAVSHVDGRFGVISGVCNHVGGPLGEGRVDGAGYVTCPWHAWKFHHATGLGEPGFEEDRVPSYATKVEGGRLWVDLASATARPKEAPRAAPPHADPSPRRARRPREGRAAAGAGHLHHQPRREQPPPEHLGDAAGGGPRPRGDVRRGDAAPQGARAQLPRLRGLLLEERAGLHLALLDHPDGPRRPDGPGLRGRGGVGRRDPRGDADPLGRRQLALLQDGRADELHPEPDHPVGQGADAEQGGGLHRHGRAGQHPGRGGADAHLLRRAGVRLPAVSLRGALAGVERGGHGEQRRLRGAGASRSARGRGVWSTGPSRSAAPSPRATRAGTRSRAAAARPTRWARTTGGASEPPAPVGAAAPPALREASPPRPDDDAVGVPLAALRRRHAGRSATTSAPRPPTSSGTSSSATPARATSWSTRCAARGRPSTSRAT